VRGQRLDLHRRLGLLGAGLAAYPFGSQLASLYLCPDILILGLGAYDLISRHRLHPACLAGVAWIVTVQLTGASLLLSTTWKPIALSPIGHRTIMGSNRAPLVAGPRMVSRRLVPRRPGQ
jgi:hypothetical protein